MRSIVFRLAPWFLFAAVAFAQGDPFSATTQSIQQLVAGPIATGGTIIGVAVWGIAKLLDDGAGSHRTLSRVALGAAAAMGATRVIGTIIK